MKFIVSSGDLLKALQLISGVTGGNSSLPVLENFLFDLDEDRLTIYGSDGETTMKTSIGVQSEDKDRIAVPSKLLTDIIKTFSEQPLTFSKKENQLEIVDEKDNYFIALDDVDQYPSIPEIEVEKSLKIKASVLAEAINNTIFATGNDAMRPVMTGILFQFNESESCFVATDAHRLVKYTRKDSVSEEPIEFIMPKKPLILLKNALAAYDDEVLIDFNDTNARFTYNETQWVCRLIDGKYPNYDAVIPKENPNVLTINRQLFLSSLKRASLFSNKSTSQVRLVLNGNLLKLSAEDLDFANKAEMSLPCDYNGEELKIGFNSKFLNEMLNNISSEDITLEMSTSNRAGIIKPVDGKDDNEDILMLVMPVMLNQ
ncbi:DNA polymerase III subunit beta [Apibacter muscae]|uniref:DNA polymerase III subunit beta n=1 Tax=Apibacter muscae TaxID=2509004 RepID=UPI0011ACAC4B|nr:DNA polymerase III subunit beta [Apibacter muscae]TWP23814.1 DNA polymerase III subunit beta [Apibacter muscae]